MKLRSLMIIGATMLTAAVACQKENPGQDTPATVEETGIYYLGVNLSQTRGALPVRATQGNYNKGDENENKIKNVYFVFYDEKQEHVTTGDFGATTVTGQTDTDNLGYIAEAAVALTLKEGQSYPLYVVAYVNVSSEDYYDLIDGKTMDAAYKAVSDEYKNGDYFIMANSVYVKDSKKTYANEIKSEQFKTSSDAAKQAPIDIYVERLAAKVELTLPTTTGYGNVEIGSGSTSDPNASTSTLNFNSDGWILTGENKSSSFLKQLDDSWITTAPFTTWNKETDYRCFWAKDLNYDGNETDAPALEFHSWTDASANSSNNTLYCHENTFTATAYTANVGVATHLVICGHYTLDNETNAVDLYLYNGRIYKDTDLKTHWADNGLLYTQTGTDTYTKLDWSSYTLKRIVKNTTDDSTMTIDIDGTVPTGYTATNHVTLAYSLGTTTVYMRDGDTYTAVDATNLDTVNEKLRERAGEAAKYADGKTYFTVPIEHLAGFGTSTTDKDEQGNYLQNVVINGSYGVVRNHWYQITISDIKGLGTGVFNPDEVIIPGTDDQEKLYYLGARLKILSWQTVNQSVEL